MERVEGREGEREGDRERREEEGGGRGRVSSSVGCLSCGSIGGYRCRRRRG